MMVLWSFKFADLKRPSFCQTAMLIYIPRQNCYRWLSQLLPVKPGTLSGDMVCFFFLISESLLKTSTSPTCQFRAVLWPAGTKPQSVWKVWWHFSKCFCFWLAAGESLVWSREVWFNTPMDLGEMQVSISYSHPSSLPFWGLFHR